MCLVGEHKAQMGQQYQSRARRVAVVLEAAGSLVFQASPLDQVSSGRELL